MVLDSGGISLLCCHPQHDRILAEGHLQEDKGRGSISFFTDSLLHILACFHIYCQHTGLKTNYRSCRITPTTPQSIRLLASRQQQGSFMYNLAVSQSNHPTMCPIIMLKATPRNGYRGFWGYLKGLENMEASILSNKAEALYEMNICTANATNTGTNTSWEQEALTWSDEWHFTNLCFFVYTCGILAILLTFWGWNILMGSNNFIINRHVEE